MGTVKISATLSEGQVTEAKARVGERGLSHYLDTALARQLQVDRLADLERELEQEFGPVPDSVQRDVDTMEWPS